MRAQLAALCEKSDKVTRLALDGSVIAGVHKQLSSLPPDATHLAISAGGNDLLGRTAMLFGGISTVAEALLTLSSVLNSFETEYRDMVEAATKPGLPLVLCTVYNPNEPNEMERTITRVALAIFNDAIIRVAGEFGLPVIDLRAVCDQPEDFANPIEPSAHGGEKIARAIHRVLTTHAFSSQQNTIYHK